MLIAEKKNINYKYLETPLNFSSMLDFWIPCQIELQLLCSQHREVRLSLKINFSCSFCDQNDKTLSVSKISRKHEPLQPGFLTNSFAGSYSYVSTKFVSSKTSMQICFSSDISKLRMQTNRLIDEVKILSLILTLEAHRCNVETQCSGKPLLYKCLYLQAYWTRNVVQFRYLLMCMSAHTQGPIQKRFVQAKQFYFAK